MKRTMYVDSTGLSNVKSDDKNKGVYIDKTMSQSRPYPITISWDDPQVETVEVERYMSRHVLKRVRQGANMWDSSTKQNEIATIPITITAHIPKDREKMLKESEVLELLDDVGLNNTEVIEKLFGDEK